MTNRIDGGVVVGWSGTSHEIVPDGSVLIDGNTIKSVGVDKTQPADHVIDASGKIVCPGFINLRTTRYGPARDPINALVGYGNGADVETVIVDGEVVVENGRSTRINDEELFAQAEAGAKRAWDGWSARDWNGRSVEQINPPAFPPRNT
jgi:cytosine/adenosine deaminase-related metal-dependent hydrolase